MQNSISKLFCYRQHLLQPNQHLNQILSLNNSLLKASSYFASRTYFTTKTSPNRTYPKTPFSRWTKLNKTTQIKEDQPSYNRGQSLEIVNLSKWALPLKTKGKKLDLLKEDEVQEEITDLIKFYTQGTKKIIKDRKFGLNNTQLQNYFEHSIKAFLKYKDLKPKERARIRQEFITAVEKDYELLGQCMLIMKGYKNKKLNIDITNNIFKFLCYCYSLSLQSRPLYEQVVKHVLDSHFIFQFDSARRLAIVARIANLYEDGTNPDYQKLLDYFQEPENFKRIMSRASKQDILSIIGALSLSKQVTDDFKTMLCEEVIARLDTNIFTSGDVLKLFTSLCLSSTFSDNDTYLLLLEPYILDIDLKTVDRRALNHTILKLDDIRVYSKSIYSKVINFLTQNPGYLTEETFISLLRGFEHANISPQFLEFLNKYMKDSFREKDFSVKLVTTFMYQFVKKKALDIELFGELEKYLGEILHDHDWTVMEFHRLFYSCIMLAVEDSPIYGQVEPYVHKLLRTANISIESFSLIAWELLEGYQPPNFEVFKTIVAKIRDMPKKEKLDDIKGLVHYLNAITAFILKSRAHDREAYQKQNKLLIEKELISLKPHLESWINNQDISSQDIKTQALVAQAFLTLKLEFPELMKGYKTGEDLVSRFESSDFQFASQNYELLIDVQDSLKEMGVKFQTNKSVFVHSIDLFIEPNIIVLAEEVDKFTRTAHRDRSQFLQRYYQLEKLGYKVVRIPFFEFRKIFFNDFEKKKEYLSKAIFGTESL